MWVKGNIHLSKVFGTNNIQNTFPYFVDEGVKHSLTLQCLAGFRAVIMDKVYMNVFDRQINQEMLGAVC